MKKTFFTLSVSTLIFALIISSCKKNNTTTSGGSSSTSGTSTLANGNPTGAYNGVLYSGYGVSGSVSLNACAAVFFNNPMPFNPGTQIVGTATVNSVSINSTSIPYNNSNNDYSYSTTSSLGFPPATWVVNGIGTISSFTYTNNSITCFYRSFIFP